MKSRNITILGICIAVCVFLVIAVFFGGSYMGWGHMGYDGDLFTGWMMPLGMIGMIAFWIFVALIIFRLTGSTNTNDVNAEKHLKERLSKGEITIPEYEEILKKIKEDK